MADSTTTHAGHDVNHDVNHDEAAAITTRPHRTHTPTPEPVIDDTFDEDDEPDSYDDSAADATTVKKFTPVAYSWLTAGGGADKLADSQVAPLVALARGNETVTWDHKDLETSRANLREITNRLHLPDRRHKQGKEFQASLEAGDILIMPWWSVTDLVAGADRPSAIQYRPEVPTLDDDGRERKYELVAGSATVIGAHPSTPAEWFTDRDRPVLLAEGQLKADSALTAALLAAGITRQQLRLKTKETVDKARKRLSRLMAALDPDQMPLITEMAGIHNWRAAIRDLNRLRLEGRTVWVGVDGDVTTNLHVHSGAKGLWETIIRAGGDPMLLAPEGTVGSSAAKIGIDDYLAAGNTWEDLLTMLSPVLPDPEVEDGWNRIGEVRCSNDMTHLEKCEAIRDNSGNVTSVEWLPTGFDLAGRIVSTSVTRYPMPHEIAEGTYDPTVSLRDDVESEELVEIELGWVNEAGQTVTEIVSGPVTILNYLPEQWDRQGAKIPAALLRHPQWPPRGDDSVQLLAAIKQFRREDTVSQVRWRRNGWVPVPNFDVPAYIVGEQKVCDPAMEDTILSDVTQGTLEQINQFGLGRTLVDVSFDDAAYRRKVKADLEKLVEVFVTNGAWTNKGHGPLVVAAGLRPTLPLPCRTTIYAQGRSGGGKSWTAAAMASFWARRPGSFTSDSLPGGANDSEAFTVNARSRSIGWVMDDLAPSANPQTAQRDTDKVEKVIRSQHNGKGPARMTKDGTPRPTRDPHGPLIITAENKVTTKSILQRCLVMSLPKGSLGDDHAVREVVRSYATDDLPARVSQTMAKFVREVLASQPGGWAAMYAEMQKRKEDAADKRIRAWQATGKLTDAGLMRRYGDMLADLYVVLDYLRDLMEHVGVDEDVRNAFGVQAKKAINEVALEGLYEQQEQTLSKALLVAISQGLAAGHGHILNGSDPTVPPGDGDKHIASALGWLVRGRDDLAPRGETIGHYLVEEGREPFIMLSATAAFNMAARHYSHELGGSGVTKHAAWSAFYEDGLDHAGIGRKRRNGRLMNYSERRISRTDVRVNGVAVRLEDVLRPHRDKDDDGGDDSDD